MAYEVNKYFEFFVIDEGYYPEINDSSIKYPKNRWQSTFPHADIVELLKFPERALSRSSKKSLWLEGSYGTDKSRIIWMMQNLLSCSEAEFDSYFDEYDNLRGEIDLRERLRTIRNGKVVTAKNKLKTLVLFWDEFSKFFFNNRNNIDEFQRPAELTNIASFYLVIATHKSESLVGADDQGFRIIFDRFTHKNITMPDNIAFELIGHALKVRDVAKNDWKYISAALKERTVEPRRVIMDFAKIRDEKILTDILPIHPMTAILLKNLAQYFTSNQRSVFNFIKNSDPNIKTFQDFIATKIPENGDLLTIDYLWNFFMRAARTNTAATSDG